MNKFRAGKIKREHTVIEGLWPLLEHMAQCDLITSIIPGPISPLNARGLAITFQRFTDTGLRLLGKNGSAVQEVWVVTPDKDRALRWLADEGLVDWEPAPPPAPPKGPQLRTPQHQSLVLMTDQICAVCGKLLAAGSRALAVPGKRYTYAHTRCLK